MSSEIPSSGTVHEAAIGNIKYSTQGYKVYGVMKSIAFPLANFQTALGPLFFSFLFSFFLFFFFLHTLNTLMVSTFNYIPKAKKKKKKKKKKRKKQNIKKSSLFLNFYCINLFYFNSLPTINRAVLRYLA
jgi:hypothetical protein